MTLPKHIIILVLILFAFGQMAKAQSSARNPYEGATHTYTWSGLAQDLNYDFYITANEDGSGLLDDGDTGEFDILNSSGQVGEDGKASTPISWFSGAFPNTYFLWIQATNAQGCSNYRYVKVTPQVNDFDILAFNNPVDNTESCPSTDEADGFNPVYGTDSPGTTTLKFKVIRENGNRAWSFVPKLNVEESLGLTNFIIEVKGDNSGEINADGDGRYNVNELDDNVIVSVSIENAPNYERKVTLEAFDGKVNSINLSDGDNTNDAAVHTIKVMPLINSMGGV